MVKIRLKCKGCSPNSLEGMAYKNRPMNGVERSGNDGILEPSQVDLKCDRAVLALRGLQFNKVRISGCSLSEAEGNTNDNLW
jgi:hypothetical protein